jgi:hypothetical protein
MILFSDLSAATLRAELSFIRDAEYEAKIPRRVKATEP